MVWFIDALRAAGLIDDMENIILRRLSSGGYIAIDQPSFESMFGLIIGDYFEDDKYTALVAADSGRGYTPIFDDWHAQGII